MSDFIHITLPNKEKDKFRSWINSLKDENDKECKMLITTTLHKTARRAKMFAPVASGFLRGHIHVNINNDLFNDKVYGGSVYSSVSYAPYQEFGTRPRAMIPGDAGDFGIRPEDWKVANPKRKTNVRPNPFLLPAIRIGYKEMIQGLNNMGFK